MRVHAEESVSACTSGEIYRAFHSTPPQVDTLRRSSFHAEDIPVPISAPPPYQTVPLADVVNESPLRESAHPIATTDQGQVRPVNHLRSHEEPQTLPAPKTTLLPSPGSPSPIPLSPKGEHGEKNSYTSGTIPMLVTTGGTLFLVVGLFLIFAWMMRRTSTRTGGRLPDGVVEVLGHQPITGRQQVYLLRIGKRLLLLSVMPDSIETLTEITDPAEIDRIAGLCHQSSAGSSTGAFQAMMRQFTHNSIQTSDPAPTVDQLRQRLGR